MMGPMAASCVTTRPAAWLSAAGVFTGTLLATEHAVLEIDEAINRDALEASFQDDIDGVERALMQACVRCTSPASTMSSWPAGS